MKVTRTIVAPPQLKELFGDFGVVRYRNFGPFTIYSDGSGIDITQPGWRPSCERPGLYEMDAPAELQRREYQVGFEVEHQEGVSIAFTVCGVGRTIEDAISDAQRALKHDCDLVPLYEAVKPILFPKG